MIDCSIYAFHQRTQHTWRQLTLYIIEREFVLVATAILAYFGYTSLAAPLLESVWRCRYNRGSDRFHSRYSQRICLYAAIIFCSNVRKRAITVVCVCVYVFFVQRTASVFVFLYSYICILTSVLLNPFIKNGNIFMYEVQVVWFQNLGAVLLGFNRSSGRDRSIDRTAVVVFVLLYFNFVISRRSPPILSKHIANPFFSHPTELHVFK